MLETSTLIALIVATVAIVQGLVRVVEYLIIQRFGKKNGGAANCPFTDKHEKKMDALYRGVERVCEVLSREDKNGIPLAYYPRTNEEAHAQLIEMMVRLSEKLVELANHLYNIAAEQQRATQSLQSLTTAISKLEGSLYRRGWNDKD